MPLSSTVLLTEDAGVPGLSSLYSLIPSLSSILYVCMCYLVHLKSHF